jgi:hypothetical protein
MEITTEHGAIEGKKQTKEVSLYNLDAIISIGYRVNSIRATQFRQWCTYVLRQFAIRGYVIDKKRMENGTFIGEDYFDICCRLVNSVLDMAERMAKRHIPMTMEDWAKRIDIILEAGGDAILTNAGSITAEFAKTFAESEFEKYRIIQDHLFSSDFDRFNDEGLLPLDFKPEG